MPSGVLTRRAPTAREQADIAFGWELASEMGRLDVGQSVAIKERAVLAVEAIEGTDQAILRAGSLCPSGGFVRGQGGQAAPGHALRRADGRLLDALNRCIAPAAGCWPSKPSKTIILDQADTIALADRYGITVVALAKRRRWPAPRRDSDESLFAFPLAAEREATEHFALSRKRKDPEPPTSRQIKKSSVRSLLAAR